MKRQDYIQLLTDPKSNYLDLLNAAYTLRKRYFGNTVTIHIINNVKNGYCPENCGYCAQASTSTSDIIQYSKKNEEETLLEAKKAYEAGAHRYCMVFSGRELRKKTAQDLAKTIKKIKENYSLEVCVSAGLLTEECAKVLSEAGLDRYNHNLNTSEKHYPNICTTHTFQDRKNTLQEAQKANLSLCSGIIVGLGETAEEIVDLAYQLKNFNVASIPINFYIPIPGTLLKPPSLTPIYCLKVLSIFRLIHPKAEIRMAAGRELHLRSLQPMGLYSANSLFIQGYLNTMGDTNLKTLQMIQDAGFEIDSPIPIDDLIKKEERNDDLKITLKKELDLRPTL